MSQGRGLATGAVALLVVGCASTRAVTVAEATEGKQGFGVALHKSAVSDGTLTVGQAASVVDGFDGVWRVSGGGDELQFCDSLGKTQRCRAARFDTEDGPGFMVIMSPGNLGNTLNLNWGGRVTVSEPMVPVTKHRGIWVGNWLATYHCHAKSGSPVCREATFKQDPPEGFLRLPLGVFVVNDLDVTWFTDLTDIFRCEAGSSGSAPICARAEMH